MKQTVFLTGATGFLAQHLIESLAKEYKLIGQIRPGKRYTNKKIKTIALDINDTKALTKALPKGAIVIHCYSLSPGAHANKETYERENITTTKNLLRVCAEKSIKKFIYVSSTSIVGPNSTKLITEATRPNPDNHYGWSKREAEKLIEAYGKKNKVPVAITRLSTLYGPGMNKRSSSIKLFKLMRYKYFVQIGSGKNYYEYTYIKNAAVGITKTLKSVNKKNSPLLLNIADNKKVTFNELIRTIAKYVNPTVRFIRIPVWLAMSIGTIGDIFTFITRKRFPVRQRTVRGALGGWVTDTKKAQKTIKLTQPFSLDDGIRETTAWLKKERIL